MVMPKKIRKFMLVSHITFSVSWIGAVVCFLALAISGLSNIDPQILNSNYYAMNLIAQFVIVPLAFATLISGIVQGLGTSWGLVQHYWVLVKLSITVVSTVILLLKLRLINELASAGLDIGNSSFNEARLELIVHAAGGILLLLIATFLSVYKPKGLTSYGRKKMNFPVEVANEYISVKPKKALLAYALRITVFGILAALVIKHLMDGGLRNH